MYTEYDCGCNTLGDCECSEHSNGGLGFFDPASIGSMASGVWNALESAWGTIESWFGIGDGRREADVITKLEGAMANRLAEIVRAYPSANVAGLQGFYQELAAMKREYIAFVSDARFEDGRASQQALDAEFIVGGFLWLVNDNLNKIAQRIYAMGGIPQTISPTQGMGPIPSLQYPSATTFPGIPQSGTIWPNAPLSPIRPAPIQTVTAGADVLPMLLVAGAALAVLKRK